MPKLWIMSDLHLEAVPRPEAFRPERPAFDVLVVAGDVWEGDPHGAMQVVARLAAGKPAVFVLGNHEFWRGEVRTERDRARRTAERLGVTLLDDSRVVLAGVRFVGGTLWADGALAGAAATPEQPTGEAVRVRQGRGERPITGADEAKLHRQTRKVIAAAIADAPDDCPLVVVTHHAPHALCLPPTHRSGWAAGNAASDLSDLIGTGRAALWVHGHVHAPVNLVAASGTRIVCNPVGPGFTNLAFQDDLVAEV